MEADEAIYAMHDYNYNGNKLVVEFAGKKKSRGGKRSSRSRPSQKIHRQRRYGVAVYNGVGQVEGDQGARTGGILRVRFQ